MELWLFIFCRVLISVVPFVCHFIGTHMEGKAAPLAQVEQRQIVQAQQNPDLIKSSQLLSWQGISPATQFATPQSIQTDFRQAPVSQHIALASSLPDTPHPKTGSPIPDERQISLACIDCHPYYFSQAPPVLAG